MRGQNPAYRSACTILSGRNYRAGGRLRMERRCCVACASGTLPSFTSTSSGSASKGTRMVARLPAADPERQRVRQTSIANGDRHFDVSTAAVLHLDRDQP